jgi:ATP-binding protein involved in chromosome partitioning
MFQQLNVEVLGVVENMSYFIGDDGKEYDLFGKGGAERMAGRLNVPFLGAVPITIALRENSDAGNPSANFAGSAALKRALENLVENVEKQAALAAVRQGKARPTLKIN